MEEINSHINAAKRQSRRSAKQQQRLTQHVDVVKATKVIAAQVFSTLLLSRLKCADVESKIWNTQFGFRPKRGTQDAFLLPGDLLSNVLAASRVLLSFLLLTGLRHLIQLIPARFG